jgi:hypothetical protein
MQKKPGVTIKETSRCVKSERVNKLTHTMLEEEEEEEEEDDDDND